VGPRKQRNAHIYGTDGVGPPVGVQAPQLGRCCARLRWADRNRPKRTCISSPFYLLFLFEFKI
jgi:hypothetical protein